MVENRTISALIDIGSEATLVRKSCIKGIPNAKIRECGRRFKGVSGRTINVIGECLVQVSVTPSIKTLHLAVVVPDHLLDTDFLFGADLLGKYDVGWSAARSTFTWAGYVYKTCQWLQPQVLRVAGHIRRMQVVQSNELKEFTPGTINIHLSKKVTLRKRSVEVMKFKVKSSDKILQAKLELGIKDITLLVRNQDGYVYLPIFNMRNGTLRYKAGTKIATIEPVQDIEHLNLDGDIVAKENDLLQVFKDFFEKKAKGPSLCTVCDSHFEVLTEIVAGTPEDCHLINAGGDKELCVICYGMEDESSLIRSVLELENAMLPTNLQSVSNDSQLSRVDKLKALIKNQNLTHLTRDQRKALRRKILQHDQLFVLGEHELGRINITPVKLELENE